MKPKVIQSHVWYGEKQFFVSTINRESSSPYNHGGTYSETFAWEWPEGATERGKMVGQDEAGTDATHVHFKVCKQLAEHGKWFEEE